MFSDLQITTENELYEDETPATDEVEAEVEVTEVDEVASEDTVEEAKEDLGELIKIDIDGETVEVTAEELITSYKQHKILESREATLNEKEESLALVLREAKSSPRRALEMIGYDPMSFALETLEQHLLEEQEAELNPDKKLIRQLQKEKEDSVKQHQQQQEEQLRLQKEKEAEAWGDEIQDDILNVLREMNITKPTPRLIARIADQMLHALNKNESLDTKRAVKQAKSSINSDLKEYIGATSVENLLGDMDKDTVEALRKHFTSSRIRPNVQVRDEAATAKSGKKTLNDIFGGTNGL